jgi:hypothetical protein
MEKFMQTLTVAKNLIVDKNRIREIEQPIRMIISPQ